MRLKLFVIQNAQPNPKVLALDHLSETAKVGKINPKILRVLFKVVIDDILYEISCVLGYVDYLKDQIKRLNLINKYHEKAKQATKEKTKSYYLEGIKLLLQANETIDNYKTILDEYQNALTVRQKRIDELYNEIKIIKKLKVS